MLLLVGCQRNHHFISTQGSCRFLALGVWLGLAGKETEEAKGLGLLLWPFHGKKCERPTKPTWANEIFSVCESVCMGYLWLEAEMHYSTRWERVRQTSISMNPSGDHYPLEHPRASSSSSATTKLSTWKKRENILHINIFLTSHLLALQWFPVVALFHWCQTSLEKSHLSSCKGLPIILCYEVLSNESSV